SLPGADHRRVRLPQIARPTQHLSPARSEIHGQLPSHDVLAPVQGLRAQAGSGQSIGFDFRPPRRPRAELLDRHRPNGRFQLLEKLNLTDPLLDIAKNLEKAALQDSYFVERKLYPNVDFYSGIIMRAIGIPIEMFTVIFAIGRMPGWIANYKEVMESGQSRIYRPRQIYTGPTLNHYTALKDRK